MKYKASEILQFVEENDVKFIRLAFCDVYGHQKNIAIMPDELPRAFEKGISFAASAVEGFMNVKESDLFLIPDPSTLTVLPWRPSHGRVVRFFCDIRHPDGTPFAGDGRHLLKQAVAELNALGLTCQVGTECEFYLFELDEKGNPTSIPQDRAGYCDIAPLDRGENVRREICLTLEEMGIKPESSHHEHGPGQNEVDFRYSDALTAADNMIHFESVVKTIANRNGLCASFMPKPLADAWGSGLHINLSLFRDGVNIFRTDGFSHNQEAESFIAGILDRICEITLFLNPITNSYRRLGNSEAPGYISWSHQNRSQLIRIPATVGERSRMELRSPDLACNPYLAFTLLIKAGLEGIREHKKLPAPLNLDLFTASEEELQTLQKLPRSLKEALDAAAKSTFLQQVMPEKILSFYLRAKKEQWKQFKEAEDKQELEHRLYFIQV